MSASARLQFSGSEEELAQLLVAAARAFGGWAGRDRKSGEYQLVFGHFLSVNPNTIRWRARARRDGNDLVLAPTVLSWPWTRAKHSRIVDFRLAQVVDYIEVRLRGGKVEKFAEPDSRLPFVTGGSGTADLTMSWMWLIASCVACGLMTWFATTLGTLILMDRVIADLADRSALVASLRGVALPSPLELGQIGFSFRLQAAALLAFPIAFFIGATYGLVQVVSEFWIPLSRASWLLCVFFGVLLLIALVPLVALHAAVGIALLVPTAAHAGYTLVWGRKGEKRRPLGPKSRRPPAILAAVLLAGLVIAATIPQPRAGKEVTLGLVGFRDRYLLPNAPGRWLSLTYYRFTLYGAEPLKDFYDASPDGYDRSVRTALFVGKDPEIERHLRRMHFVTNKTDAVGDRAVWSRYDLVVVEGTKLPSDLDSRAIVAAPRTPWEPFSQAVAKASRETFRGRGLRDLAQIGWLSVFYLGPFVLFSLPAMFFLPIVSILFRKLPRKAALAVLAILGTLALASILAVVSGAGKTLETIRTVRKQPAEGLLPYLSHEEPNVRFEAALRLCGSAPRTKESRELLVRAALEDPDTRVRLWACGALGKMQDPEAIPPLLRALEDREIFVRYRAAEALGDLRAAQAIEPLLKMAREDWWYCGMYALAALRRIRPDRY